MTKEKEALYDRLTKVQNNTANRGRDIMTFAGFMSTVEELAQYVERHEQDLAA